MKIAFILLTSICLSSCVTRKRMYDVSSSWGYYGYMAGYRDGRMEERMKSERRVYQTAEEYLEKLENIVEDLRR